MGNPAFCVLLVALLTAVRSNIAENVADFEGNFLSDEGNDFPTSPALFQGPKVEGALAPADKANLMPNQETNDMGAAKTEGQNEMGYEEAIAIRNNIRRRLAAHTNKGPISFSPAQQKFLAAIQNAINRAERGNALAVSREINSSTTDSGISRSDDRRPDSEYVPYSGGYRMVKKVEPQEAHNRNGIESITPRRFHVSSFESDHVELLPDGIERRHSYSQSSHPAEERPAVIPRIDVENYIVGASSYLMSKPRARKALTQDEPIPFVSSEISSRIRKPRDTIITRTNRSESKSFAHQPASRANAFRQPLWITLARARKNWEVRFKPSGHGVQPYLTVREQKVPGSRPVVREGFLVNNTFRMVPRVQAASPVIQADTQQSHPINGSLSDNIRILNLTSIDTGNMPSLEQVPMEFLRNVLNVTSLLSNDEYKRKKFKCVITLETKMTICGYVLENNNR